jgi:excisionase family DNA binding protein
VEKLAYSVEELAEVIGVGKNCAYDLCKREDFPVIRIGDRRLIIPADGLRAWLENQSKVGKVV